MKFWVLVELMGVYNMELFFVVQIHIKERERGNKFFFQNMFQLYVITH